MTVVTHTAEREDVWYALSDLFLDTEIIEDMLNGMAREIARTSFSITELTEIMEDEVAPILCVNLWIVAGEWGGFDRAFVIERVSKRLVALEYKPARGWLPILKFRRWMSMVHVRDEWSVLLAKVEELRRTEG